MTIKIGFTIDDADLELGIAQALTEAGKVDPAEFLADAARSGFEQFRGANKRAVQARVQKFIETINSTDPEQYAALLELLALVEEKLASIAGKANPEVAVEAAQLP